MKTAKELALLAARALADKKAKEIGATANDVLSASYIDATYKMLGCDDKSLTLSCAVDLRRYIKDPNRIGYTNQTTFMPCTVSKRGATVFDTLKEVAECNKKSKNDEFLGLYGLPLINYAFTQLVYIQAEMMVKMFYNNASNRKIYVPNASVEDYKSAQYWRDYASYIVGYDF